MVDPNLTGNCLSCGEPTYATDHCGCKKAEKECPSCGELFVSTSDNDLRCCLDHMTPPEEIEGEENAWAVWGKEIEEYAWNLWEENQAYKAGAKTLQAEKARLEISLRAEQAVVKEMVAGLTEVSEGLEGLKGSWADDPKSAQQAAQANVRIIAAAPELLDSLKICISELMAWICNYGEDIQTLAAIEQAKAAIAKVEIKP